MTREDITQLDMSIDSAWFSHDASANEDPKMYDLFSSLGCEGYGIYWLLVEALRRAKGHKLPLTIVQGFSTRYHTTVDKVNSVIHGFDLLPQIYRVGYVQASPCLIRQS